MQEPADGHVIIGEDDGIDGRAVFQRRDVEAVDDAAEEAAAACLKGRTLADEIAALAELTVDDANALLRTALREENRAYVQIDPAEA